MMTKEQRINKYKAEITVLKNQILEFTKLKNDYLTGKRDPEEDYPNWDHPFHRTPMDWIDWRIMNLTGTLKHHEELLQKVMEEREWFESRYYNPMYICDIEELIGRDGFIIGVKF